MKRTFVRALVFLKIILMIVSEDAVGTNYFRHHERVEVMFLKISSNSLIQKIYITIRRDIEVTF